jgi:hypothetical protein
VRRSVTVARVKQPGLITVSSLNFHLTHKAFGDIAFSNFFNSCSPNKAWSGSVSLRRTSDDA